LMLLYYLSLNYMEIAKSNLQYVRVYIKHMHVHTQHARVLWLFGIYSRLT